MRSCFYCKLFFIIYNNLIFNHFSESFALNRKKMVIDNFFPIHFYALTPLELTRKKLIY